MISNTRIIQQAKRTDFSDIKALLNAVDLPTSDIRDEMLQHFLIMRQNGQLSGVIGLEIKEEYGLLRSLAIHPDFQMLGYGKELVVAMEEWAINNELLALFLLTESMPQFFKTMGYKRVDRESVPFAITQTMQFTEICSDSATAFKKTLIIHE